MDNEGNGGNAGNQRHQYQQEQEHDEGAYPGSGENLPACGLDGNRYRRILPVVFPVHHFSFL